MKVLIVNNMVPFISGGAEELANHLQKNLIIAGHESEILRIPFQWEPAKRILSQMLMTRAFELYNVDRVIALKFPAYLIRHPQKTLWLCHQYRQAYDLYDLGQTNITKDKEGDELRQIIHNADKETFAESRKIFTISEVTRQRLRHYNGVEAEVLFPPVNDEELFKDLGTGDYLFAGGRINDMKRQYLLIEALNLCKSNMKLIIAGPPDSPSDGKKLKEKVESLGLQNKVSLDLRYLPRALYAKYLNHSAAAACIPFNEDYGYVAIEAAIASKAVLTTNDSGGILAFVKHHETGWIVEPNAESLAEAIDKIATNLNQARQIGAASKEFLLSLSINWPSTVETLLQ